MEPRNRFLGTDSAILCSLAGRYDNPIPIRFLAPIDCSRIPAQHSCHITFSVHLCFESTVTTLHQQNATAYRGHRQNKRIVFRRNPLKIFLQLIFFLLMLFLTGGQRARPKFEPWTYLSAGRQLNRHPTPKIALDGNVCVSSDGSWRRGRGRVDIGVQVLLCTECLCGAVCTTFSL